MGTEALSTGTAPATSDDWRILRALSLYRLLLLALLLAMQESGYTPSFFDHIHMRLFHYTCIGYAAAALLLLALVYRSRTYLRAQTHLNFALDAIGVTLLVYACNGVGSGMGVLLITPMVGCGLILPTRYALFNAALGTLLMFGEEILQQTYNGGSGTELTATGILGLIFFGSTAAGNAVARRARRSEALAERVGSDLASLAQLNNRIIETMETGVLVIEADGSIRLCNEAARRLLNFRHGIEGLMLSSTFPKLDAAMLLWRRAESPDSVMTVAVTGADDVVPRFMSLGAKLEAPMLILVDAASRMREEAQQMKLAALGRLSASIAHEVRNPLSAINHAGQLLAESSSLDLDDKRLLGMIQRQSNRIERIVSDVLSLSRRETIAPSQIALEPWLERTLTQYAEAHAESMRPIDLEYVEDDLSVRFDPNHLQQVLHNLWDNSFLHGGTGGRAVTVRLRGHRQTSNRLPCLEILDDGPGIPTEVADQIFEPFFTTAHTGTGLGLYLARELCEYNRARLQYEPVADGACFRIVFTAA